MASLSLSLSLSFPGKAFITEDVGSLDPPPHLMLKGEEIGDIFQGGRTAGPYICMY